MHSFSHGNNHPLKRFARQMPPIVRAHNVCIHTEFITLISQPHITKCSSRATYLMHFIHCSQAADPPNDPERCSKTTLMPTTPYVVIHNVRSVAMNAAMSSRRCDRTGGVEICMHSYDSTECVVILCWHTVIRQSILWHRSERER